MIDVAEYFDAKASNWDASAHTSSPIQPAVAALAGVGDGSSVLDLGCGTGVMVSEYLKAGAERVLGVDVSPQMIARAREKFSGEGRVEFIASDAVDLEPRDTFDAAVIYNAYPHFLKRELLVRKVAELLAPHGRFTIAHGAGRDQINGHHRHGVPGEVVCELRAAEEECDIWRDLFTIDAVIDTPEFYAFSGFLK